MKLTPEQIEEQRREVADPLAEVEVLRKQYEARFDAPEE